MLEDKLKDYADMFEDGFPMYQLGSGRTEQEVIDIIDDCLKQKKDVYDLGYLEDDLGDYY